MKNEFCYLGTSEKYDTHGGGLDEDIAGAIILSESLSS